MRFRQRLSTAPAEGGFAIIEVLVSGVVAVVAAAGVMALMQTTIHSAGDQRNRTQAFALAQEDQARLRAIRIPSLKDLDPRLKTVNPRPVTIDGVTYQVLSTAEYVNDVTGLSSCGNGTATADYVKIASTVTWPNMSPTPPTVIRSIISPPSGSLNPKAGTLTVRAEKSVPGQYVNALSLSGTGTPGTFSGSTDPAGCAVFTETMSGPYTMTISGGVNLVNFNGEGLPKSEAITVNPETTTTVDLHYDTAGKISPITFKTAPYSGSTAIVQKNEKVVVFHPDMPSAKTFGTSTRVSSLEATSLFPFTSTYTVYAGSCTVNNPSAVIPKFEAGVTNVTVPPGGSASTVVTLPALLLNAQIDGVAANTNSTNLLNVKITENNATCANPVRNYSTFTMSSTAGRLQEPGLPYGNYTVCVSGKVSGVTEREVQTFDLKATSVSKTFNLTSADAVSSC